MDARSQIAAEIAANRRQIADHAASMDRTVTCTSELICQSRDLIRRVDRQLHHQSPPSGSEHCK